MTNRQELESRIPGLTLDTGRQTRDPLAGVENHVE